MLGAFEKMQRPPEQDAALAGAPEAVTPISCGARQTSCLGHSDRKRKST
jgi:hypothetical protein